MSQKQSDKQVITDQEIRELIIARLRSLSSGKKISIGSEGEFSKEELIERVRKEDSIGKKIIQIQLSYLQSFKEGILPEE